MKKAIIELEDGRVFSIDLAEIAADRATYYAAKDKDTTYDEEFKYVMEDDFEGLDWLSNNMNWWECKTLKLDAEAKERPLIECDVARRSIRP